MKRAENITPVLLGGDLNAYSVAVAFASSCGVVSHVFARDKLAITEKSAITKLHVVKGLDRCDVAVPALIKFAKEHSGERLILVPCADWYMETVEYARDILRGYFYFNLPDFEIWRSVSDKSDFYRILDSYGIKYPESIAFGKKDIGKLESLIKNIEPPYVIKPSDSTEYWRNHFDGMEKVYFKNSLKETFEICEKIYDSGYSKKLIIQKKIGSDEKDTEKIASSVLTTYSNRRGKVIRAVLADVLLEELGPRAKGNYSAMITRELDEFSKKLIGMLNAIGYRGIANFDILSYKGEKYCLELNPRQGRSSDYTRCAGVNLAQLLVSDMQGYDVSPNFTYDKIFWSCVPKGCVFKYSEKQELINKAKELSLAGKSFSPYSLKEDMGITRRAYVLLHKIRQRGLYKRYTREAGRCY